MKKFILNKKNQFFSILIEFLFISIFFISCSSTKIFLPGEKEVTTKNIYSEYLSIAENYYDLENFEKAIYYFNLCLSNKENYWNIYYKMARCYAMLKKWPEAEEMYERLLLRDENNATLKISLAYIYTNSGNFEKAKKIYEDLMTMYPESQDYLENYISILIVEGDFNEISVPLYLLIDKFPDSSKIKTFQQQYDKLVKEYKEKNKIVDENAVKTKIVNEPTEIVDDITEDDSDLLKQLDEIKQEVKNNESESTEKIVK